jgi:hypothetical protein
VPRQARTSQRPQATGGLYQAVRELVEEDACDHEARVSGWHGGRVAHPYPLQRILDALRAGKSVDVPMWAEPKWARTEISEAASRVSNAFMRRTVVRPNDTFTVVADDGSAWLADNGM